VCAAATLLLAACSADDADVAPATTAPSTAATTTTLLPDKAYDIVGTALQAGVFTQLAGLVVEAGLVDTLRGGPFTVFAPTDDAFLALSDATWDAVMGDPDLLATVLTYHVVPGALTAADLQPGALTTVAGIDLTVSRDGNTTLINGVPIAAADVEATNGIIHVMGEVLVPPS
jgi:uncharacterized surface protein with fasciclin (FAS1) repeats